MANIVTSFVGDCIGRKIPIIAGFIISGLALLLYKLAEQGGDIANYACLLIGNFGANLAFLLVNVVTLEIFPTAFRGGVIGICNVFSRLGGILAPLTVGFSG